MNSDKLLSQDYLDACADGFPVSSGTEFFSDTSIKGSSGPSGDMVEMSGTGGGI